MQRYASIFFLVTLCFSVSAQGFLKTKGKSIANDNGVFLLKSIGTGNWMIQEGYMMQSTSAGINTHTQFRNKLKSVIGEEKTSEFYSFWLNNHFTKADLDSMKAWGFNALRPALHYKWFTLPIEEEKRNNDGILENTWLDEGFNLLDSLVEWCAANQMYVIFDMHGTPGGQGKDANISDYDPQYPSLWESTENQDKLVALWVKIAERYKNNKWVGGYDLINEPNWNVDGTGNPNGCGCEQNTSIWELYHRLIKAVRKVDNKHIIFVAGNCWGNNYNGFEKHQLNGADDNMALTFHKYWNTNSSGSIAGWLELQDLTGLPIWMSESGENSNQWFADAIGLFESHNIGWSWWPVKKHRQNNVLKVTTPQSYIDLLKSWEEGQVPLSAGETYKAVMDFARAHQNVNCTVGRDVIYAMLHYKDGTEPFKSHSDGQWISFADYDLGREGMAYHDSISQNVHDDGQMWKQWNSGQEYRNDGVDIGRTDDGVYVGWTEEGEWLRYTIAISHEGRYRCEIQSAGEAGILSLEVNGKRIPGQVELKQSSEAFDWQLSESMDFVLPEGEIDLKIKILKDGARLKAFKLIPIN